MSVKEFDHAVIYDGVFYPAHTEINVVDHEAKAAEKAAKEEAEKKAKAEAKAAEKAAKAGEKNAGGADQST